MTRKAAAMIGNSNGDSATTPTSSYRPVLGRGRKWVNQKHERRHLPQRESDIGND